VRLWDPSLQPPQPRATPGASRVAPSTSRARWRHTHGCESARTTGSPATRSSLSGEVHKPEPATSPGQAKWEQATLDADERSAAPTALQPAPPSGRPRASSATPPRPAMRRPPCPSRRRRRDARQRRRGRRPHCADRPKPPTRPHRSNDGPRRRTGLCARHRARPRFRPIPIAATAARSHENAGQWPHWKARLRRAPPAGAGHPAPGRRPPRHRADASRRPRACTWACWMSPGAARAGSVGSAWQ
jgi:hypothetical protein